MPMSIMADRCFSSARGIRIPNRAQPNPRTPKRNFFASGPYCRVSRAKHRIIVNFASSEGWNWIPAMEIHRWAPLTLRPMTNTSSNSAILTV